MTGLKFEKDVRESIEALLDEMREDGELEEPAAKRDLYRKFFSYWRETFGEIEYE